MLEPALGQHRVVMDTSVVRADLSHPEASKRGLYQLTHLTSARGALKHDDRLEVLAAAVGYWAEQLNADAVKAEDAFKRRADAAWEREFFKGTFVTSAPPKVKLRGAGRRGRW